jgi:methionine synthase I (cobalamin-dependent)/5,10-methylenetetrahydrofolate reductase
METFRNLLQQQVPILTDGAMGTMLHAGGVPLEACFDAANLLHPDVVSGIHRDYIEAGAQIIETNSFGANRFKLAIHGLEGQAAQINRASVQIARQAILDSSKEVYLAGSVGPLGVRLAPFGRVAADEARQAFREQMEALLAAGVDLLLLETHTDLHELREAIQAARDLGDIPIVACVTFTRDDRTLLGDTPRRVAGFLDDLGVDAIGANCSSGPAQLLRILGEMRAAAPGSRLCVMPNAGWPETISGRVMYPATPEYFRNYAVAFCEAGATIIGGCCGTTPEHIAHMHAALENLGEPCLPEVFAPPALEAVSIAPEPIKPTRLSKSLASGRFIISVEMDPPRGLSPHKLIAGAHLLAEAGADTINVADSPMARMRMSPWAVCHLIQQEVGIETVLHFPTRGRNVLRVQGDLLAAHALDVRNIFIVMGDPTEIGDYPEAMDDYDVVPSGLIQLVKQNFNSGIDLAGSEIGDATSFFVGCALNLTPHDVDREIRLLNKKINAGADFALSQPIYDASAAQNLIQRYSDQFGEIGIPLIAGVLPLFNHRHAAFLHNEVPGINIPAPLLERISASGENATAEGLEIALELIGSLSPLVQGIYIMPPFGRYELAAEIIERVRGQRKEES